MKTTIVIPTYNEAGNIEPLVTEIFSVFEKRNAEKTDKIDANILIVDDDSADGTVKIAEQLIQNNPKIKFISRKGKNRSFSRSYIDGFKEALKENADCVIQMDADFSHDPKYLPLMAEELKKYDVIIGSRYLREGKTKNWSLIRRLVSRGGNIYSRLVTGLPFSDSTAGFVGWRSDALKKINLNKICSEGYGFQIEMKFHARKNKLKMKETPIVFIDRKFGASKMRKRIVLEAAITCLKLRILNN